MDKYTIIKLKQKGKSNRTIAKELGINRKTVSKYWNQYLEETNKLTNANYDVKEVQETIVSAPSYDTSNRKYRKYTKEMV